MNNLLMYNIPPEKSRKIKAIALQLGFRIRVVKPEEQSQAVGCLAGLPVQEGEGSVEPFTDEMLVLCGVEGQAFHAFLSQLRAKKAPVTLKAVLTEHNAAWTSSKLHASLLQEHQAIQTTGQSAHTQE